MRIQSSVGVSGYCILCGAKLEDELTDILFPLCTQNFQEAQGTNGVVNLVLELVANLLVQVWHVRQEVTI